MKHKSNICGHIENCDYENCKGMILSRCRDCILKGMPPLDL